jgi:serine/threonine protein kinase
VTDSDRPLDPGTIIANNYRVATRLGAGGMGTVYLADNITLNQRVVVKVLRGGAQGAGQEEAQIMANLQHPNVVTVYAHDPSRDCIVMEFLDGASLSTLLEKGIDRVNAIRVALAVADALAAVHRRGLVHRDIKPENVMLALNAGGGRLVDWLKLIDFGLALKAGKKPQVLLGTPEYCGPEQFLIEEAAHPANDIYALGVTIFLMMSGRFPFDGERESLPDQHFNSPPPSLLETLIQRFGKDSFDPRTHALLEDLDELLHQMLAKKATERPTAQEVARRLTRLESSFAEAGTYVGAPAPAISVASAAAGKRRSGTGVLKKATDDPITHRNLPNLGDPLTEKRKSLPEETTRAESVVPFAEPPKPSALPKADTTGELAPPAKSNKGLIIALVALVVLLAGGVAIVTSKEKEIEPPLPVADQLEPAKPPEKIAVVEKPAVVAPVAIDAGVAAPEELDELSGLPNIKKKPVAVAPTSPLAAKAPKPPACRYDDAYEKAARNTFKELGRGVTGAKGDQLEDLSDELATAFKAKDCKQVDVVLSKVKAVVTK